MTTSDCPFAYDQCRAARPTQSRADPDFLVAMGASGDWLVSTSRCSHCGGYWSQESNGTKRRRSYVENNRWIPVGL